MHILQLPEENTIFPHKIILLGLSYCGLVSGWARRRLLEELHYRQQEAERTDNGAGMVLNWWILKKPEIVVIA